MENLKAEKVFSTMEVENDVTRNTEVISINGEHIENSSIENEKRNEENVELIKKISRRYYRLCTLAAENEQLLRSFHDPKKTRGFLTDGKDDQGENVWGESVRILDDEGPGTLSEFGNWPGIGMTLPKDITIVLDHSIAWPTIFLTDKESEKYIQIKEIPRMVRIYSSPEQPIECDNRGELDEFGTVNIYLDEECKTWNLTLHMPDFIPNEDALTQVYMGDKKDASIPDIVLTSC